jgi:hypothetical protein
VAFLVMLSSLLPDLPRDLTRLAEVSRKVRGYETYRSFFFFRVRNNLESNRLVRWRCKTCRLFFEGFDVFPKSQDREQLLV